MSEGDTIHMLSFNKYPDFNLTKLIYFLNISPREYNIFLKFQSAQREITG